MYVDERSELTVEGVEVAPIGNSSTKIAPAVTGQPAAPYASLG